MNNNGCSLIWGHPQGPTGLRAVIELIEELVERGGGYGLFTGGFGLHYGIEKVGSCIVPAASGNTRRQIAIMRDLEADVATQCNLHIIGHLEDKLDYDQVASKLHVPAEAGRRPPPPPIKA